MKQKASFDWKNLSPENLKTAQKVFKVILNFFEFRQINRFLPIVKIRLQKFENEQVCLDDIINVLNRIDTTKVKNDNLHQQIKEYERLKKDPIFNNSIIPFDDLFHKHFGALPPSNEELNKYVFIHITSLDDLRRAKNIIDEKLKETENKGILLKQKEAISMFFDNMPPNTTWQDIELKFENEYDLLIYVKDKLYKKIDYLKIGFYDHKNKKDEKPDKKWIFLRQLSVSNGEFDLKQFAAITEKDKYRQYKKALSDNLQKLFGINEDPFDEENSVYKVKFKIKPVPLLRGNGEAWGTKNIDEDNDEIQDYTKNEIDKKSENHKIKTYSED